MPPVLLIALLVILILLPLAARRRGAHAMMALAALAWIIAAAVGVLAPDVIGNLLLSGAGPSHHDTFFIVSHVKYQITLAILMLVLAAVTWWARPVDTLVVAMIALMHLAMAGALYIPQIPGSLITAGPETDLFILAERLETLNNISALMYGVSAFSLVLALVFVALAVVRRLRGAR